MRRLLCAALALVTLAGCGGGDKKAQAPEKVFPPPKKGEVKDI